ncbi:MAG: DUF547 domain-containing protein [Saprospiraceae bacterium]
MLLSRLFTFALLAAVFSCGAMKADPKQDFEIQPPVSHALWNELLQRHVKEAGFVDYKGVIRDSVQLGRYLALLESAHPNSTWSKNEQMAYWINAYNAYTVKLIIDHYPVASIKDIKNGIPFINTVWDIKFIHIQGQTYDLNNIEHGILRKEFPDARVHAAVNCASYSCPRLQNEAFVADKLEQQLEAAMRTFVNDPLRNRIQPDKAALSAIFNWFAGDFKRDAGTVRAYVNRFLDQPISANIPIEYISYDWSLNEVR